MGRYILLFVIFYSNITLKIIYKTQVMLLVQTLHYMTLF